MEKKVTVVARLRAKKGKEVELKQALMGLLAPTRREEGCINYDLYESRENAGLFYFYENWASGQAIDRHLASPHIQALLQRAGDLLAEPPDIQKVDAIG